MKILVLGPEERYACYRPEFADALGAQLIFSDSPFDAARADPDIEIVFTDPLFELTGEWMDLLPKLRLIQSEGVAYHRIDTRAAADRGIYVCNCKGCNAASVAEHTVMLMLMALRFGLTGDRAVREGRQFEMKERVMAADSPELGDCAVGLVGFGDIGQAVARRLLPFGCRLFYYSRRRRSPETEAAYQITYLPLEELVRTCQITSLHCAVNEQTKGMVDEALLRRFRPGAILVNTARGELIRDSAVRQALADGRLSAFAADTLAPEPVQKDNPLVELPPELRDRTIFSPHLGGNTGGAFRRAHRLMWQNACRIAEGSKPENLVNG